MRRGGRILVSLALTLCVARAGAQSISAGESAPVTLPLWNVLTLVGTGATCVSTRLSDTPGSGQSQGTTAVSGSATVTVGPYSTVTRHSITCTVGSLAYSYAPASFVVTGGIIASDIDASDVPADEECLTYEGTGPALEWQACGSGGGLEDGDYGDVTVSGTGTAIDVDADSVALGTDTTGNYAGSSSEGGAATTATALAANGANCSAGSYPLGVDASGAAESCTAVATEASALAPAVVIEGTTADDYEGNFAFIDPTADWTWTLGSTGAVSGVPSITGGTSGTSTLTLDGDSGVAGTVTIGSAGSITVPTGSTGGVLVGTTLIREDSLKLYVTDNAISAYRGIYALSFQASGDISAGSSVSVGSSGVIHIGGDTGLIRESAGVMTLTNNSTGKRAFFGGGAAVASATALPVPAARMFHVTGTTTITSITSTNLQDGVCVTLIFDDVLTFTDGGNLRLNGDFVTSADDTLSLCYDGTNWFETSRSFN